MTPLSKTSRKMPAGPPFNLRESEIQEAGVNLLRRIGFLVKVTSQRRASSVSTGMPDVVAVGRGLVLFWEAKVDNQPKLLSEKQKEFGAKCRENGVPWCFGPMTALMDLLKSKGVLA